MRSTSKVSKRKTTANPGCHGGEQAHPDHSYALSRLRRAEGQLAGIIRMVEERRYCVDILVQFRAAMAALRTVEAEVFETHLRHCLRQAMESRDPAEADRKIEELTRLLVRRTQI